MKKNMIDPISTIAAALAIGLSGVGAGYAEAHIGAAAVGSMTENSKNFAKGLIFTVIPETIVVFGFVIAIMILL